MDALSRVHADTNLLESITFTAYYAVESSLMEAVRLANSQEEGYLRLHELSTKGELPEHFSVQNGLVCYRNRLFVLKDSALASEIMHLFHDSKQGGHAGVLKTYKRITE